MGLSSERADGRVSELRFKHAVHLFEFYFYFGIPSRRSVVFSEGFCTVGEFYLIVIIIA